MSITDIAPLSTQFSPTRAGTQKGDIPSQGFAEVLHDLLDPVGQGISQAPAIRPEIGSAPKAFEQRPLLLLTALSGPARIWAAGRVQSNPEAGGAGRELAQRAAPSTVRLLDLRALSDQTEDSPHMGRHQFDLVTSRVVHSRMGVAKASQLRSASSMAARVATPPVLSSNGAPTQSSSVRLLAEPGGRERAWSAPGSLLSATNAYAAPRQLSQFTVQLLAGEKGLRLVIRTPALTPEERTRLDRSIARVFAESGMSTPLTIVRETGSFRSGGND